MLRMRIEASEKLKERAKKKGLVFSSERIAPSYLLDKKRTVGLLLGHLTFPVKYLGTITLLRHKIKDKWLYRVKSTLYRGKKMKLALKVLGKRRVRIYQELIERREDRKILFFGTKEGTVAVAPVSSENKGISILRVARFPSKKMAREMVYGSL